LVGEELHNRGDPVAGDDFQRGNWQLAELYLEAPSEVSLIGVTGQGTLEERGAWWLFLRYLRGQAGGDAIITALTQTTLSSIDNVEAAMQSDWPTLFSDWGAALELERQLAERSGLTVREALQFRGIDLVDVLGKGAAGFLFSPSFTARAILRSMGGCGLRQAHTSCSSSVKEDWRRVWRARSEDPLLRKRRCCSKS
jgi:hypothetical protein